MSFCCLTKRELEELIMYKIKERSLYPNSEDKFFLSSQWNYQLGILILFLAQIIEKNNNPLDISNQDIINIIYCLPNEMYVEIQEIDQCFIDSLLRRVRQPSLTLEEELVENYTRLMNHDYTRIIRN